MRYLFLLAIIFIFQNLNAQENQALTASSWEDGSYTYYVNAYRGGGYKTLELEKKGKEEIKFIKDDYGFVTKILLRDKEYIGDQALKSDFIRYYECSGSRWRLFVMNDSKIIIIEQPGKSMRVLGSLGGKVKKSDRKKILDYMDATKSIQKEDIEKRNLVKRLDDVESVEIEVLKGEGAKPKETLEFGVIYTFDDGVQVKTNNLGGLYRYYDAPVQLNVEGATHGYDFEYTIDYCDIVDNNYVKISVLIQDELVETLNVPIECARNPEVVAQEIAEVKKAKAAADWKAKQDIQKKKDAALLTNRKSVIVQYAASQESNLSVVRNNELRYFNIEKNIDLSSQDGHQLAILEDGENYVVLNAFANEWENKYESKTVGYYLTMFDRNGNKIKEGKSKSFIYEVLMSSAFSSLTKTDFGYIAVHPRRIFYFDSNLNYISSNGILDSHAMLKAISIKGTDYILIYTKNNLNNLDLHLYNYKTNKWLTSETNYIEVYRHTGNLEVSQETKGFQLFSTIDDNIIVTATGTSNGNDFQAFFKYDLNKIMQGSYDKAKIFYYQLNNVESIFLTMEEDGLLHGVNVVATDDASTYRFREMTFFSIDPSLNTKDGFDASYNSNYYAAKNNPISEPKLAKKIGKYYYVYGLGNPTKGHAVDLVGVFNFKYELVGYNRLKLKKYEEETFLRKYEHNGGRTAAVYYDKTAAKIVADGGELPTHSSADFDYDTKRIKWERVNAYTSFDMAHISGNSFYILQDHALLKVSTTEGDFCPYTTEKENPLERYASTDVEEEEPKEEDKFSKEGKITILNDLGDNAQIFGLGKVVIELGGGTGNDGVVGVRGIPQGHYIRVYCDTERIYNDDEEILLRNVQDYCGKTIKLSSIW